MRSFPHFPASGRAYLRLSGALLLSGAVWACSAQGNSSSKTVSAADEAAFEHAMQLLDGGKTDEAKPLLEALNHKHPRNFQISESLGLLYASAGDLQSALPLLESAAHAAPTIAPAHANLGTAYLKLDRVPAAIVEFQKAVELNPADAQTQSALGQALMLAKQPCEAAGAFSAAANGGAADADLTYNTSLALYDCGRYQEAAQTLARLPGLDQSAPAQSLLGDIDEKNKAYKQAADHYLRATQLDPSEANVYTLGIDLLRHWSFDPAVQTFSTGVQKFPDSRRMLSGLGIAYYGAAHYAEAIDVFSKLLQTDPENTLYGEIFGRACTVLTDSQNASCTQLRQLAQQHPRNANLGLYAAIQILHQPADPQQLDLAKHMLENTLKSDPTLPTAHYELGVLLQQENQWADSVPELQKALAEDPKFARAHYRLGLAYRRTGRKEDAQKEMALDQAEDQEQRNDLNARMQQITTLLVKMR